MTIKRIGIESFRVNGKLVRVVHGMELTKEEREVFCEWLEMKTGEELEIDTRA